MSDYPGELPEITPIIKELGKSTLHPEISALDILNLTAVAIKADVETTVDGRRTALSNWTRSGITDELRQPANAAASALHDSAIAILKTTNGSPADIASGTAIDISGRTFIATCSHFLPSNSDRLIFTSRKVRHLEECTVEVLGIGSVPKPDNSSWPDVGFVELPTKFVKEVLGADPLPLENVGLSPGTELKGSAILSGFAEADCETKEIEEHAGLELSVTFQIYSAPLVPSEYWHRVPPSRNGPQELGVDLVLPYRVHSRVPKFDGNETFDLCDPVGLSGGGYWVHVQRGDLWHARDYRLIGIQSLHPQKDNYLQGTQIHHWLRLVASKNEDLADAIGDLLSDS